MRCEKVGLVCIVLSVLFLVSLTVIYTFNTSTPNNMYPLPKTMRVNALAQKQNATLCLVHNNDNGFGNKMYALIGWLALARVSNRSVALTGPSVNWQPFWNADFLYERCDPSSISVRCNKNSILNPESECFNAIFGSPEKVVEVDISGRHGDEFHASTSHPLFHERYSRKVREVYPNVPQSWINPNISVELVGAMEIPSVLASPTSNFLNVIREFEKKHNLKSSPSIDAAGSYSFDLALHVRSCVDCGWRMKMDAIRRNIKCAIEELGGSERLLPPGSKVFVTSDSREILSVVKESLPSGVILIDNIPRTFIHTRYSKVTDFNVAAMPYLDNYMLGQSRFIGSCWTSFALGALRVGGPQRLHDIVRWQHHPQEHNPNETTFLHKPCNRLPSKFWKVLNR